MNFKTKLLIDREALPSPKAYYRGEFPGLDTNSEWAKVLCPFHDDHHPSLNINLCEGHFKCHACEAKGGDIIAFHRKRYSLSFIETCEALGILS